MSFEGYYRKLCENGHLHEFDVHLVHKPKRCDCGADWAWKQTIDETNGLPDGCDRYPEEVTLEVATPEETATCDHCGVTRLVRELTYKIPRSGL